MSDLGVITLKFYALDYVVIGDKSRRRSFPEPKFKDGRTDISKETGNFSGNPVCELVA